MFRAPTPQTKISLGLLVLLAALTLALFWPAVGYDYINLDDPQYVFGNASYLVGFFQRNARNRTDIYCEGTFVERRKETASKREENNNGCHQHCTCSAKYPFTVVQGPCQRISVYVFQFTHNVWFPFGFVVVFLRFTQ